MGASFHVATAVILSHRSGEFVGSYEQSILKATIFSLVSSQWVHLSSEDSVISRVIIVKGLEMLMKNGLDSNFVPDDWMADPLFVAQKNNANYLVKELINRKICVRQNYDEIGNALNWVNDVEVKALLINAGADTSFRASKVLSYPIQH